MDKKDNFFAENYIASNSGKLPKALDKQLILKNRLKELSVEKQNIVHLIELKDPVITLILSLVLGFWGADRFYNGQIGLGILKIITIAGFGIWWFIDLFLTYKDTQNNNFTKILSVI